MSVLLEVEQAEALSLAAAAPARGVIERGVIEQGVIEEARRRRRSRRIRAVLAIVAVGLAGVIAWTLAGEPSWAGSAHASSASAGVTEAGGSQPPAFNIRLVPVVSVVGEAGWCEVIEERGVTGGSACGGVPTPSEPFLQIQGSGEAKSRVETQTAVADPRVAAILVGGTRRVPTVALPGLPYGLRGARIVTSRGATLTALDAGGHRIAQQWAQPARQGAVSSWRYPQAPPHGVCQIRAVGVRGLSISGGTVATTLRPFPGQLVGHAFVPCVVIRFRIGREPLKASLLLDAAHPRSSAGGLPNFRSVPGAPGVLAEGGLDAMRARNAWLIVGQGRGRAQRIGLLRHLIATVSPRV
jgi:hypothetical protein